MAFSRPPLFFGPRHPGRIEKMLVAVGIAVAGLLWPGVVRAAGEDEHPAQARFREVVPWLPKGVLPAGELIAFEEHREFVYLSGRPSASEEPSRNDGRKETPVRIVFLRPSTLVVDVCPFEAKQGDNGRPAAMATVEVPLASGEKARRAVCVYRLPGQETAGRTESLQILNNLCEVAISDSQRKFQLVLPLDPETSPRIAVESAGGDAILPWRRLPAGVMPYGPEGMRLVESWDSRYRGASRPGWDMGFPSSHLKSAVEGGAIKPGRAVELGCGTGTNAVYLAEKGFDVTAIEIAPTALNLAQEKADKAGVKVRWVLADVLAPPADLGTFDFIFDRGCYHGVRRGNAQGYVKTLMQLSRPGTHVLILAGNANEERRYGPPRVKEEELRGDFSPAFDFVRLDTVRFDSADPNSQGALAWSALLRRKAEE